MSTVRISPKFQVVIPKGVREELRLKAGQEVEILYYDNRIELIPIYPLKKMRGFLKGIHTTLKRDADRL